VSGGGSSAGGNAGTGGGGAGAGGADVDAGDGGDGAPACDETKSPTEATCLVSDKYAVFVSKGALNGTGSKESPVGTIAAGLAAARTAGLKRVIVCNATYPENVAIANAQGAVSIYGGFSCPVASNVDAGPAGEWTYNAAVHAVVAPLTGSALTVTGATNKVVISDVDLTAADATVPGTSSIGAIVATSTDVTLLRVKVTAGNGAKGTDVTVAGMVGADGPDPANPKAGEPAVSAAKDAVCSADATTQVGATWANATACNSRGGAGGTAIAGVAASGGNGTAGQPMVNLVDMSIGTGGPGGPVANSMLGGMDGSGGLPGAPGSAASALGTFSDTGFTSASGSPGADGYTGQGGGGGGASAGASGCAGASGGVGGMGGCGGLHAAAGTGGGASIALLSWSSGVVLNTVQLVAATGGDGGRGGNGGQGGNGQGGTLGGVGVGPIVAGGGGGRGGNGGDGGAGSGGTGGPSFALASHGTKPTEIGQITATAVAGGKAGKGGAAATNASVAAADGKVGTAQPRFEIVP
jgi:hypothetical protein